MIIKTLKRIFYRCWDFSLFITGEGSWNFRPIEMLVLNAIKENIESDVLELLNAQLSQKFFIQRMNANRINTIVFYEKNKNYKIKSERFHDLLFKVEMLVDKRKEYAHVTFFKGYIASIEFKKSKKFYIGKDIKVGCVKLVKSNQSHASAIDRIEHGKPTQEQ